MVAKGKFTPDEIKLKPFTTHGISFESMSGNDHQADCPFCGKRRAFHVDPDTTKWVCSSGLDVCGRTGNLTTFIEQWHDHCLDHTTEAQYAQLSRDRGGMPAKIFARWAVAYNALTQEWLFPNHKPDGRTHDLRRWKPGRKPMGTPTIPAGLWNAHELQEPSKLEWPVWICEGESDGMAMWHLVRLCGIKVVVVAVPGANILKEEWEPWFKGRDVVFWYDRDSTGEGYSWKKAKQLAGIARSIRWHFWPAHFPEKYDVRDCYVENIVQKGRPPSLVLRELNAAVVTEHPLAKDDPIVGDKAAVRGDGTVVPLPRIRPPTNPTWRETLTVYEENFKMTKDLIVALRYLFAVVLSQQIKSEPCWGFVVGPPGSGKTALLMSLQKLIDVSFHSTVTSKALLSGFKEDKKEGDPSIIPKLIAAGVGVFKDFTQLLGESNEMELQAVSRVLRGAFDGVCDQFFGNGVSRRYVGRFTLLAGVTDEIHAYSEATVGERFMKFQLISPSKKQHSDLLMNVLYSSHRQDEAETRMADAAKAFLDRDIPDCDPMDIIPQEFGRRIAGLAELIDLLRHKVSWDKDYGYEKVLRFRPRPALGTRLVRQLGKLAMALSVVDETKIYGHHQHSVVERVAFDTGIGFNLDIIEAMMAMNGGNRIARNDLAEAARIPRTTLARRIEDMHLLDLIKPSPVQPVNSQGIGRTPEYYDVDQHIKNLWAEAAPGESHLESARAADFKARRPAR